MTRSWARKRLERAWREGGGLGAALAPLSVAYGAGLAMRGLVAQGTPFRASVPVISVGGLTAGGSGKTPLVAEIVRRLRQRRRRPAILSRGYGRRNERALTVVSDGSGRRASIDECGDEPAMLADGLPGTVVVACADRQRAAEAAVAHGADVLVLDDGFQRRREFARDLDLLALDGARAFGNGRLLPAGPLRERPSAAGAADAIVFTSDGARISSAEADGFPGDGPVALRARLRPIRLRSLTGAAPKGLTWLRGRRVIAACGIAHPSRFGSSLERAGAEVARLCAFPDHHRFTERDAWAMLGALRSDAAEAIVVTSKDAGKLSELPCVTRRSDAFRPVLVLEMRLEIRVGSRWLDRALSRILSIR